MELLNRFEHPSTETTGKFKIRIMEAWDEVVENATTGDRIFIFCHGYKNIILKQETNLFLKWRYESSRQ